MEALAFGVLGQFIHTIIYRDLWSECPFVCLMNAALERMRHVMAARSSY